MTILRGRVKCTSLICFLCYSYVVSIGDAILNALCEPKFRYKGVPVSVLGIPTLKPFSRTSISSKLQYLKRKGYVVRRGGREWVVTKTGRTYQRRRQKVLQSFTSPFAHNSPRTLVVMFDIPETRKIERDWLRSHLKRFHYRMIQQSVWVGPSPLPTAFSDYLKVIDLGRYVKTFKLARPYDVK